MDRLHALNQASLFESNRARDLAAVAGRQSGPFRPRRRALCRPSRQRTQHAPGCAISRCSTAAATCWPCGIARPFPCRRCRLDRQPHGLSAGKDDGLAFTAKGKIIAVTFDPAALAPASLLARAALLLPDSRALAGAWSGRRGPQRRRAGLAADRRDLPGQRRRAGRLVWRPAALSVRHPGSGDCRRLAGRPVRRRLRAPAKSRPRHPQPQDPAAGGSQIDGAPGRRRTRRGGSGRAPNPNSSPI